MALHTLFRTAVVAGLLVAGGAAQAGTVTFNNWFHGSSNIANVTPAFNNNSSFNAGAFKVTLSNFTGGSAAAFNGKSFEAYCVELTEYFNSGGKYHTYEIVAAAAYFSAPVASKLTQLVSYVNNNSVFSAAADKDMQSTALQLAIWNTVYDSDATLDWHQDAKFSEGTTALRTTTTSFRGSDDLLGSAGSSSGYSLYVLKSVGSPGQQDQLIWLRNDVPEPASLALVVLALGGAAFASRRRG